MPAPPGRIASCFSIMSAAGRIGNRLHYDFLRTLFRSLRLVPMTSRGKFFSTLTPVLNLLHPYFREKKQMTPDEIRSHLLTV